MDKVKQNKVIKYLVMYKHYASNNGSAYGEAHNTIKEAEEKIEEQTDLHRYQYTVVKVIIRESKLTQINKEGKLIYQEVVVERK